MGQIGFGRTKIGGSQMKQFGENMEKNTIG